MAVSDQTNTQEMLDKLAESMHAPDKLHCDFVITDFDFPICLRYFLLVNRLPAADKLIIEEAKGRPTCFASYKGKRVRITMASRFGDVGISENLEQEHGYQQRVLINELSNFSEKADG